MKKTRKILSILLCLAMLVPVFASCNTVQGPQGEQGATGEKGEAGETGADGITPELRINDETNEWEVSYDNGNTWASLGIKATGEQGIQGETGATGATGATGPQGPQGEVGATGSNGLTPYIGDNGNWWIGGADTGSPSRGNDGKSTSISISPDGYWIIDNTLTDYKVEGDNQYLFDMLKSVFEVKENTFIADYETLSDPSWNYTTSTFSGWGGSIGSPESIEAISIRVRARDKDITQIKFHLNTNDKNGELILSELLDVYIPAKSEAEIVWKLPQKITANTTSLYFSFNCNQFCDLYSNIGATSKIPSNEYQAVMSYTTNGKLLDSTSKMVDVASKPCRYIYVKIGRIQDVFVPRDEVFEEEQTINVFLPNEYDLVANDNFQLFYRGVVQAADPYKYSISVACVKGNVYSRYFEWTPTIEDIGSSYKLTLTVYDDNGKALGVDTTTLNVHSPNTTNDIQNILCIGDSLTAGGYWVKEAQRRFTEEGGNPNGLGLEYLNFIGTVNKSIDGKTISCEGYSGWTWEKFCSSSSPFYDEDIGDISFKSYCEKNSFDGIDVVYIFLTWNGQGTPYKTDYAIDKGHFYYAQKLIDKLHEDFPDATIRCMGIQVPSQNGGMGYNYGANSGYSNAYGMLVTAMNYNATLEEFCKLQKYRNFVKYIDIAGQFDTDYNMPSASKPVNNRNNLTEVVGTNGVHPSINGYYQIADVVFRSLCEVFSE